MQCLFLINLTCLMCYVLSSLFMSRKCYCSFDNRYDLLINLWICLISCNIKFRVKHFLMRLREKFCFVILHFALIIYFYFHSSGPYGDWWYRKMPEYSWFSSLGFRGNSMYSYFLRRIFNEVLDLLFEFVKNILMLASYANNKWTNPVVTGIYLCVCT